MATVAREREALLEKVNRAQGRVFDGTGSYALCGPEIAHALDAVAAALASPPAEDVVPTIDDVLVMLVDASDPRDSDRLVTREMAEQVWTLMQDSHFALAVRAWDRGESYRKLKAQAPPASDPPGLVEAVKRFLNVYTQEVTARNRWVEQADPDTPESHELFSGVMACEAATREAAMALHAAAYPLPASPQAETMPTGTCPECGPVAGWDEDGCCRTCGHDVPEAHAASPQAKED